MDQRTIQILLALVRSAVCGTKLTKSERESYSSELLQDLLKMSAKHDVVHLLALGLKQNDLIFHTNESGCPNGASAFSIRNQLFGS